MLKILYFQILKGDIYPSFKRTVHPSNSKNKCLPSHILFYCPNLYLYLACSKKSTEKASVERKAFNFKIVGVHSLLERSLISKTHMKNLNR